MQIACDNKSKTGESVVAAIATADNGHLFPCSISLNDSQHLTVKALIDTGSLQANYLSPRVAEWLRGQELLSQPMCIVSDVDKARTNVFNLGGTDMQSSTLGCVSFNLYFANELSNSSERISCVAAKIIDSIFDLIIGLPLILASKLAAKIPSFYNVSKGEGHPPTTVPLLLHRKPLRVACTTIATRRVPSPFHPKRCQESHGFAPTTLTR
jgi:hypothetical protein